MASEYVSSRKSANMGDHSSFVSINNDLTVVLNMMMMNKTESREERDMSTRKWGEKTPDAGSEDESASKNRKRKLLQRRARLSDSDIICFSTLPEPANHVFPASSDRSYRSGKYEQDEVPDSNGNHLELPDLNEEEMIAFAKLDQTTLKVLGWSSGATDGSITENGEDNDKNQKDQENLYRLTKEEFKRLSEQVRDVNMNLKNKFRSSTYQRNSIVISQKSVALYLADRELQRKLYQHQQQMISLQRQLQQQQNQQQVYCENGTQIYRTQLAASLKAFRPKDWAPLKGNETEVNFFRCKPVNCQSVNGSRPGSTSGNQLNRPCRQRSAYSTNTSNNSRPNSQNGYRRSDTPSDIRPGNFDTLTPQVLANLIGPHSTYKGPTYGDRIPSPSHSPKSHNRELRDGKQDNGSGSKFTAKDDDVSTSGIDSTQSNEDDITSSGSSSSESDDDSDYEPSIDQSRDVPNLHLRPEKLDSIVVPDSAKGWRKFDFDADETEYPPYEFADPLPEPYGDIDFRQTARMRWSWKDQTKHRPDDVILEDILDRMVELERLQLDTEDWEQRRAAIIMNRRAKRAASAKMNRDKRCCNRCLQPACTGDCPEKLTNNDVICEFCRQVFCTGNCRETKYEQRMRQTRANNNVDDEKQVLSKPPLPRSCKSCQTKTNAKLLNANNLVLGRPKSGNVTFSRGIASAKQKDLRPLRPETPINTEVIRDFEKLGIEPFQSSRQGANRNQRPKSRNSQFPSKSFFSQRRDSLTEVDNKDNRNSAKLTKRKSRSSKLKRPKTAA